MAESEIKWIKLSTGIFDNDKIKQIEALPDGDSLIVIWLKLLVLAGEKNDGGAVYFTKTIPYSDQMLSVAFRRPLPTVQLALRTFESFGMIEIINDFIMLPNWEKYQNVDGMERVREQAKKRMRNFRARQRLGVTSEGENCVYCGKPAETVDHIVPICKGGQDIVENLVPCCKSCNSSKTKKDLVDFLNDSFYMPTQNVDHDLVRKNEKLMAFVEWDERTHRYTDVTQRYADVTHQNKNKIENKIENKKYPPALIEKDINNEGFIQDAAVEEKENVSVNVQAAAAENPKTSVCTLVGKAWNKTGFPKVRSFPVNSPRGEAISALNEQYGTETMLAAIEKAKQSEFLNELGDRVTLDWFLKPEHFQKIIEGQYDRKWERMGVEPQIGPNGVKLSQERDGLDDEMDRIFGGS